MPLRAEGFGPGKSHSVFRKGHLGHPALEVLGIEGQIDGEAPSNGIASIDHDRSLRGAGVNQHFYFQLSGTLVGALGNGDQGNLFNPVEVDPLEQFQINTPEPFF